MKSTSTKCSLVSPSDGNPALNLGHITHKIAEDTLPLHLCTGVWGAPGPSFCFSDCAAEDKKEKGLWQELHLSTSP